jgi:hypothetical protein
MLERSFSRSFGGSRSPGAVLPAIGVVWLLCAGGALPLHGLSHPATMSGSAGGTAQPPVDRRGWANVTAVTRQPSPGLEAYSWAVYDAEGGTAMVFGGLGPQGNVSAMTWIFDDGNWELITPVINGPSPPPLYDTNLAFDASDGYLLLFGGRTSSGAPYGGTWSWSYAHYAWTNRTDSLAPPPESGGGMAYDPASGLVVLDDPASNLTWTYHGGAWSSRAISPSPGPRTGAVMVTDSAAGNVFLFGGEAADGGPLLNDTWSYTEGTWTRQVTADGPPPFENGSGTDDPILGGVFLVGSSDGSPTETWSFVRGGWTEYAIGAANPPPRLGATLAYDSSGASILCGGTDPGGGRWLDDCWTWGVIYVPPKAVANASPFGSLVVDLAIAAILVPLLVAIYWNTRPKRPDITRVPTPSPTGSGIG